jgi:tRNA modification GTPase
VSTPRGTGGIAVIRVSGPDAFKITKKIFISKKDIEKAEGYTILFGHISDGEKKIDDVLVSVFRAPKSFTGENICEISCHGGVVVSQRILDLLVKNGAEYALPGEFTKRAFMNGKMSLTQAEAVHDIISAETISAADAAIDRISGGLSEKILTLRDKIIKLLAMIQVSTDFPDEDIDSFAGGKLDDILTECINELDELLKSAVRGIFLTKGASCVIAGLPNTGKSSLLNALLEEDKAIVTDIPGTTRDSVEGRCQIGGVTVNFQDTAGIRETEDIVEKMGVNKSKELIKKADFVIFLTESGRCLTKEENEILDEIGSKTCIKVLNKCDVISEKRDGYISISAKNSDGIDCVKKRIEEIVQSGDECRGLIANERQRSSILSASNALKRAKKTLDDGFYSDLAVIDISECASDLGEAEGMSVNDEVIDRIFKDFCLGK